MRSRAEGAARAILQALRRIVRVLREASREAEKVGGVSGAQLFVMHSLQTRGPMTISALARTTMTHQSSVSVVVQRLVDRGLVTRGVSTADRRRREVALTAAGRRLLARAPDGGQTRLLAGIARMPTSGRAALATQLEALVQVMGADREPADMFFEDRDGNGTGGRGGRGAAAARRRRPRTTRTTRR
jgi:DNA-binding MarR family transcriptional regulator